MKKQLLTAGIFLLLFQLPVFGQKTTESGLKYEILESTNGFRPEKGGEVKVKLTGFLEDGTVFQEPAKMKFTIGEKGLLPGFVEAVQLLKEGEKGKFTLPPELGYGKKGSKNRFDPSKYDVPPNATIVFEIELVKVK